MQDWAITRAIPATFSDAISQQPRRDPIDVARAREQHRAYVSALRSFGVAVEELPPDDAYPDCCFVEDCAVVARGVALITNPGAPSRRGEPPAVRGALARRLRIETMAAPATLDGGDCLVAEDRILVGLSARTNAAGVARLREVFAPLGLRVVPVELGDVLHLKCVCSSLGGCRVLVAEGLLPDAPFEGLDVVSIPREEAYAANVVAVGKSVLAPAGFPATHERLRRAGYHVVPIDNSETRKADGSLTCLSIIGP